MGIRLYDTAWVRFADPDLPPAQVIKNTKNPAIFEINGHQYDIDGRSAAATVLVPEIAAILPLSEVRALGLQQNYNRDIRNDVGGVFR
jgi:hypothetical protein